VLFLLSYPPFPHPFLCLPCSQDCLIFLAFVQTMYTYGDTPIYISPPLSSTIIRIRKSNSLSLATQAAVQHRTILQLTGTCFAVLPIEFLFKLHIFFPCPYTCAATSQHSTFRLQNCFAKLHFRNDLLSVVHYSRFN
jgi:Na+/phosphate symporter